MPTSRLRSVRGLGGGHGRDSSANETNQGKPAEMIRMLPNFIIVIAFEPDKPDSLGLGIGDRRARLYSRA